MSRMLWALVACFVVQGFVNAPCWAQALDAAQQHEVDALTKQIEANPKDVVALAKRGFIFKKAGIWDKAAPDFERCLVLNPNWQQGYIFRSGYLEMNGKLKAAVEALNKAEEIRPLKSHTIASRGNIYYKLKEYRSAIADLSKSIELAPNDYDAYASRACAKFALYGATKDVESDLEKCLSLNPLDELSRQLLNDVRQMMKNGDATK